MKGELFLKTQKIYQCIAINVAFDFFLKSTSNRYFFIILNQKREGMQQSTNLIEEMMKLGLYNGEEELYHQRSDGFSIIMNSQADLSDELMLMDVQDDQEETQSIQIQPSNLISSNPPEEDQRQEPSPQKNEIQMMEGDMGSDSDEEEEERLTEKKKKRTKKDNYNFKRIHTPIRKSFKQIANEKKNPYQEFYYRKDYFHLTLTYMEYKGLLQEYLEEFRKQQIKLIEKIEISIINAGEKMPFFEEVLKLIKIYDYGAKLYENGDIDESMNVVYQVKKMRQKHQLTEAKMNLLEERKKYGLTLFEINGI